jgi:lysophospholipase L1-like esterase
MSFTAPRDRCLLIIVLLASFLLGSSDVRAQGADAPFPTQAKKILFLGDSITNTGHYISIIETRLRMSGTANLPEMINLGLPSETACGLSEPDHPFPRPDVHERIDRALAKVKPDVVVACYGMNDGIYYPFSAERFATYQQGIKRLIKKVHEAGAKLILMTPPAFDPLPLRKQGKLRGPEAKKYAWFAIYENYDQEVLKRYAKWIMEQKQHVAMVIDLHTPVIQYVATKREKNPDFTMSPDGVHVNSEGHAVLADAISQAWQIKQVAPRADLLKLVSARQSVLHQSWLSHVGHKRPGVAAGVPLVQAKKTAATIDQQISALLDK